MIRYLFTLLLLASIGLGQEKSTAAVDSSSARVPAKALYYSFIPGAGQLYNKKPLKALLFSGVFIYFGVEYLAAQNDYQDDLTNSDLHRTRNDKIWLMALTWTLNILDAYVDAQLWDFDKYPMDDSELPEPEIKKPEPTGISDENN